VVIKQYGELRTGTNYVRALLQLNYPDALVLTYILGDKHSPPVPLDAIWNEVRDSPDADVEFARKATYAVRGPASHDGDITQLAEIRKRAADIATAYRDGSMRFLITIKDPYAWIVSVARFRQWVHSEEEPLHDWDCDPVREMCVRYNRHYAAWRELANADPKRARLIRHEDLMCRAEEVFADVERCFGLRRNSPFKAIPETLEPTVWDHLPVLKLESRFDPSYYSERRYLQRLLPMHRNIIAETIDWRAIAPFGYQPD
jgi:hypothetical protein